MGAPFRPHRLPVDIWCEIAVYLSTESLLHLGEVSVEPSNVLTTGASIPLPIAIDIQRVQ